MKFAINILIKVSWAKKAYKKTVYFDCKPEEIEDRVLAWYESKHPTKTDSLKGFIVVARTDGPAEYFPGTVFPTYKQYSKCYLV